MSDELIKHMTKLIAAGLDRIEQLTAEREALEQDNHRWKMECENFWRDREKALTADFARQVQRTDEQREAYEQALSVMEAENERLRAALFAWIGMMNDPSAKLRIEALTVDRAEARAGWHKYEGAWMAAEGKLADVEAENARLHALLAEADCRIAWEAHGFGNDFAERVEAALKGESHE